MCIREHSFDKKNGDGRRIYITSCLISLMTTTSLMVVTCEHLDPPKAKKMPALFTAFKINGWGPAVTHRWHFLWEKKIAEAVTRNNALAWRQPFCTISGGTDRHREALALSWHLPDPRLRVVTDSQAGACQAWRLSLLTSVHTISLPSSIAGPTTLTLGSLSLLLHCPKPPSPRPYVLIWLCFCVCCFEDIIYPFRPCFVVKHDSQTDVQTLTSTTVCLFGFMLLHNI